MYQWLNGLLHLIFPRVCPCCNQYLPRGQQVVCLPCERQLPFTDYHWHPSDNPFVDRFWGRLPLQAGSAMLHFGKGGRTQRLIHCIKYEGRRELALELGRWHGHMLREAFAFASAEVVVPVPLHPRKELQRGFNQSSWYGRGLGESLEVPVLEDGLVRARHTVSQTQKSRLERFQNVADAFEPGRADALAGKHVLLVDDVLTTGTTLEACGLQLLTQKGVRLSLATLAIAEMA
jgi:ComF family protein